MADPILRTHAGQAAQHFARAGETLLARQELTGSLRGNVPPWEGSSDADFHGTLASIWIWGRHRALSGEGRFTGPRNAAWEMIERTWRQFIPEAIGPSASDEAAFDCAMVLRAALADRDGKGGGDARRASLVAGAARLLAGYLGSLEDLSGRDFQDPGFLAWNLIDYARAFEDRGLLATGRGFVERAFGMKAPPAFLAEPEPPGCLFDFSSTTANRVMAVVAAEGRTPFVGAWLRERVVNVVPTQFVERSTDENCWNACVASCLGRAYVLSTDPAFLDAYREIAGELDRRDTDNDGAIARGRPMRGVPEPVADTLTTFYYALASDALLRGDAGAGDLLLRNAGGGR